MDFMIVVLYTLVVVVSLLLIALILVQQPKSGGFGSNFGGLGESVFGAHASGHMTKMTVIFTSIFFALTLLLAVFVGHRPAKASVISRHQPKATVTVDESTIESDSEKQISTEAAEQTPVVEKENVKKSESKE
ncbi:MAG: preprotein translocase subunit SecG [Victivallaceae bacterium]|jgi:preprotein translocase subunit SecG|nr:preprotein translocase subunit SecG [Victivallaceae bacterium]MDD3702747.1 preprotein translocase subunit SecG [Victivallaceae bacterium]MDD4317534.1 preprotein translocase subunit SecG [Victivallaceae bacterium]MDD5662775.1 preprotein translocase subunit SecG [Victivallaceae bacterium]NLK83123.1 preprotein translocase subunit SecG [Lentisphaerota bacterium]